MEDLTQSEIQRRCDALAAAMLEKGKRSPAARLWIESHRSAFIWLTFDPGAAETYKAFRTGDIWAEAEAWIAALPDPAKEGERKFTAALAKAVDIATEYSLPDKIVAPVKAAIVEVNELLIEGPK